MSERPGIDGSGAISLAGGVTIRVVTPYVTKYTSRPIGFQRFRQVVQWTAEVPDVPGVVAVAWNLEEARAAVWKALCAAEVDITNVELSEEICDHGSPIGAVRLTDVDCPDCGGSLVVIDELSNDTATEYCPACDVWWRAVGPGK